MRHVVIFMVFILSSVLLGMTLKKKESAGSGEIVLKYTLKYKGDTWEKNRTGLLWSLSMLGAELPQGSFNRSVKWLRPGTFSLKFDSLGFNPNAVEALEVICNNIKQSEIYKKTGAAEIGYFITATLGSSWQYYKITGAPQTYTEFLKLHNYQPSELFPVLHSTVSKQNRFVTSGFTGTDISQAAYTAEEGCGSVLDKSFVAKEYNVMDVMKNGQLRFMVYDSTGQLLASADEKYGFSGKPAKCLWCHEVNVQTVFEPTDSVPGYTGPVGFDRNVKTHNELLKQYRLRLNSDIDYTKKQDHTQTELIYINYMEPSLESLAQEWKISVAKLKKLLKNYKTHVYPEFPFLGNLYYRDSIHEISIYKPGQLPSSIRNPGPSEPNFFQPK